MILNWPEDIPYLRFGLLQTVVSIMAILIFKGSTKKKLIWIRHNLTTHKSGGRRIQNALINFYQKKSDIIVVHTKALLSAMKSIKEKIIYIPHPAYPLGYETSITGDTALNCDVLIWGNIYPYKGLDDFIDLYRNTNSQFKVVIAGSGDIQYVELLKLKIQGLNIEIENKFLDDFSLNQRFSKSKIILLPYLNNSVTSGALIHSLNSRKIIIGPASGNFIDLNELNACLVYKDQKECIMLINDLLSDETKYIQQLNRLNEGIDQYVRDNSWEHFLDRLLNTVENMKPTQATVLG